LVNRFPVEASKSFDRPKTGNEIVSAISDLEDAYDGLKRIEQENVTRLIEQLKRRLQDAVS